MTKQETTPTKDYTLLPNEVHKADLETAKHTWRKQLREQGISKKQYKYKSIAKIS